LAHLLGIQKVAMSCDTNCMHVNVRTICTLIDWCVLPTLQSNDSRMFHRNVLHMIIQHLGLTIIASRFKFLCISISDKQSTAVIALLEANFNDITYKFRRTLFLKKTRHLTFVYNFGYSEPIVHF